MNRLDIQVRDVRSAAPPMGCEPSKSPHKALAKLRVGIAASVLCAVSPLAGCGTDLPQGSQPQETSEAAPDVHEASQAVVVAPVYSLSDTTIFSATPNANAGTAADLKVTSAPGASTRSLIKFAQSDIQNRVGTNQVYSAYLELYVRTIPDGWVGAQVTLHRMNKSWNEGTSGLFGQGPTYACANDTNTGNSTLDCAVADRWGMNPGDAYPLPFEAVPTATAGLYTTQGNATIRLNVTKDIQAFLAGTSNQGWMLKGGTAPNQGGVVSFDSKQFLNSPRLVLDVGPDLCPTDPAKVAPGECGCNVPETDADGDGIPNCKEPGLLPVADTFIGGVNIDANAGTMPMMRVTSVSTAGLERALVRFDQAQIAAAVGGAGRQLFKAELELTVTDGAIGWNGGLIEISKLTRDWKEGTGTEILAKLPGATWACAADADTNYWNLSQDCVTANKWGMTSPTEGPMAFVAAATDSAPIYTGVTKKVRFDVTADVQGFLQGAANNGWIIKGRDTTTDAKLVVFGSRESASPPRLYINAGPTCPYRDPGTDEASQLRNLTCLSQGSGATTCELKMAAKAGADRQAAARMYIAKQFSPAEQLALSRDRARKLRWLTDNPTLQVAACDADDDGDMVPNSVDQCADTRALRPTTDDGCEDTNLPRTPSRAAIDAVLGTMGVVYDPNCAGANPPTMPDMDDFLYGYPLGYAYHYRNTNGRYMLVTPLQPAGDQPSGCQQVYMFRVNVHKADGTSKFVTHSYRVPGDPRYYTDGSLRQNFVVDIARGGDEALWGNNAVSVDMSVNIMNGNGQNSGWTEAKTVVLEDW